MHEQHPRSLPWLDRLAIHIPGYGGYLDRGHRRAADRALRDAIAARLRSARSHIDATIRQCVDRGALTEIGALERLGAHLDRAASRVAASGSGDNDFYDAGRLDPAKADPLHAIDHDLYERAEAIAHTFDTPDHDHDRLARFEAELTALDQKLDERALLLKGIR